MVDLGREKKINTPGKFWKFHSSDIFIYIIGILYTDFFMCLNFTILKENSFEKSILTTAMIFFFYYFLEKEYAD